jgi:7-cyano-7-deazaguanine synthase in queuosine biosynthesis
MTMETQVPIRILWSSGWDSSFRLLWLLLVEKRVVEPYYLIDAGRRSTLMEFKAMREIRAALKQKDPEAEKRLCSVHLVFVHELPACAPVETSFRNLQKRCHIGVQYGWLAQFCETAGLDRLETGTEDNAAAPDWHWGALLHGHLIACDEETGSPSWTLAPQMEDADTFRVFGRLRFPNIKMSKLDMEAKARQHGFIDLLAKSWFCHRPWHGKPCGTCNPCCLTIRFGLGWRLPWQSRLRNWAFRIFSKSIWQQ